MTLALARKDSLPALGGGQPLPAPLKAQMESGFGQDFSAIRVHDNARAHDAARQLDARAFAAGNDIAFASGAWQPESASGRALIAHELAHSVQQAGVQMKRGSPVGSDSRLEAEADSAAEAVMAGRTPPPLTAINRPLVLRNPATQPAPNAPPAPRLPADVDGMKLSVKNDTPPGVGTDVLDLWVDQVTLINSKGGGTWVPETWAKAMSADPEALLFAPILNGNSVQAFKEDSGTEEYLGNWLGKYGFSSLPEVSKAITDSSDPDVVKLLTDTPAVAALAKALNGGLGASKMAIDHIVEKQVGGTSLPDNLQLLTGDTNSKAGTDLNRKLTAIVRAVRLPANRGTKVTKIRLYIKDVKMGPGAPDTSAAIEGLLRAGKVKGTVQTKAAAGLKPVDVSGGGGRMATLYVDDARKTEVAVDDSQRRLVPGMKLTKYKRNVVKTKPDDVKGELDHEMMRRTGTANGNIALLAEVPATPPAPVAAPAGTAPPPAATPATPANEQRVLKLKSKDPKGLGFHYPYLSPGKISTLDMDGEGRLTGTGIITPSVKFLGPLKIKFGPETLELDQLIDVAAVNASPFMKGVAPYFRFTAGAVSLNLMTFKPSGTLDFTMGPAKNPLIAGNIGVALDGAVFVATGKLKPARAIPGIADAAGDVSYRSDTGWAGNLKASSTSFPNSTITASLGFKETAAGMAFKGEGAILTDVRGSQLKLSAAWAGDEISYWGGVTVPKPVPLVDKVELNGSYAGSLLSLTGKADITWKGQKAQMTVKYNKRDGEEGKFSGSAGVVFKTGKLDGLMNLNFDEKGGVWGKGELAYQVTPQIKPKLGVELTKQGRWRMFGEVALTNIELSKAWPKPGGEKKPLIKGLGVSFSVPTPLPPITADAYIRGSFGIGYGLGPVALQKLVFNGELYPLEEDPKVSAKLTGRLAAPFYGELYGTFGAGIGVSVAGGAVGVKGGIDVTPSLRVDGDAGIDVDASYANNEFSFSAMASVTAQLEARLGVNLVATIYAAYGYLEHSWTYPVAEVKRRLGPTFKLTMGKLSYGREGITWPSLDQIDYEPKDFDPMSIVDDLLRGGKADKP